MCQSVGLGGQYPFVRIEGVSHRISAPVIGGCHGLVDEGAALLYVYNKVKDKITPEINAKVEDTLNAWFGPEYTWIND